MTFIGVSFILRFIWLGPSKQFFRSRTSVLVSIVHVLCTVDCRSPAMPAISCYGAKPQTGFELSLQDFCNGGYILWVVRPLVPVPDWISVFLPLAKSMKCDIQPYPTILSVL